jgi:hypothetical protein
MDIGSVFLGLALGLLIVLIVAQPFLEGQGVREQKLSKTDSLIVKREQTLTALRDLDFDHATGKITDEDYAPQRAHLVAQGAAVLKQIDDLTPREPRPLPARLTVLPTEDDLEAEIAARRKAQRARSVPVAQPRPADAMACPQCGVSVQSSDRFCPKCGTTLAQTCLDCGHSLRPTDRFCPHCGARQAEAQLAQ